MSLEKLKIIGICEMTPLIRVDDFRTLRLHRTTHTSKDKTLLQTETDRVIDYIPAIPVDNDKQIQKPAPQRQIGDINPPNLIRMGYLQSLQQIGTHVLSVKQFAEIRLGIKRFKPHLPHEAADTFPVYLPMLDMLKVIRHLTVSPRGVFQMKLIKPSHQSEVLPAFPMRQILSIRFLPPFRMEAINTAAVDLQQSALTLNTDSLIVSFDKSESFVVP